MIITGKFECRDAARIHRQISSADRLGEALEQRSQDRRRGDAKGRL